MADKVQATEVTPAKPDFFAELIGGLITFITTYWYLILIPFLLVVILGLAYYIWKKSEERQKTLFEIDYDKAVEMAKQNANKKRLVHYSTISYAITGVVAGFLGITTIILFGFMGFFMTWLIVPSVCLIGFLIDRIFKPFRRGDKIFLRYLEGDKWAEKELGTYSGDFYGNDGYYYLYYATGRKRLVFKHKYIIKIPQTWKFLVEPFIEEEKNEKGEVIKREFLYDNDMKKQAQHFIKRILEFNETSIKINFVKNAEKEECFYYPVIHDIDGNVIDYGLKYYESDKRNALIGALYNQTSDFSEAMKDGIKINPHGRFEQFVGSEYIDEMKKRNLET
jgi:hypothetical protein